MKGKCAIDLLSKNDREIRNWFVVKNWEMRNWFAVKNWEMRNWFAVKNWEMLSSLLFFANFPGYFVINCDVVYGTTRTQDDIM